MSAICRILRHQSLKSQINNRLKLNKQNARFSSTEAENDEESELDKVRNVSRMNPKMRRANRGESQQFKDNPSQNFWWMTPTKSKQLKGIYLGKFGMESGIDPGILWPTKNELKRIKSIENEFYPTLQTMMENVKKEKEETNERRRLRVKEIEEKLEKSQNWIKDLENRKEKKLNEAKARQEKREKLLDEVRAHFGYIVDPKDEKFKELVAEKEKEERKAKKEAKKKEFIAKELAKMQAISEKAIKEKENIKN